MTTTEAGGVSCVVICVFLVGVYAGISSEIKFDTKESQQTPVISKVEHDPVKPLTAIELAPIPTTDDWMKINVELNGRSLYFTAISTPKYFDEILSYIWTDEGCYAYDLNDFTLDEIYQLIAKKKPPVVFYDNHPEFL